MEGFLEVVKAAWGVEMANVDACRSLDRKLRFLARALKIWSASNVGSI